MTFQAEPHSIVVNRSIRGTKGGARTNQQGHQDQSRRRGYIDGGGGSLKQPRLETISSLKTVYLQGFFDFWLCDV